MFDVRGFGAKGDKKHNDSRTIQEAMDACFKSGGGTVVFPAGDYLSGSVFLKSRITLHLEAGATLWCSRDPGDYAGLRDHGRSGRFMVGTLLTAEGQEQIAVEGCAAIA